MPKELFNQTLIETPDEPDNDIRVAVGEPSVSGGFNIKWSYLKELVINAIPTLGTTKSYSFTSQGIGTGEYYSAGFYELSATDANLTQSSLNQTFGSANNAYAAHAFIVAGGAGTVDTGVIGLKVTGTRIEDDGTRTAAYDDIISTDITTLSTDDYLEAAKYIGQVTFSLYIVSGTPTAYSLDFNYGLCKYEDFGNNDFILNGFECVGTAGANDSSFDIELIHHKATGWTYSAAAFTTPTPLFKMSSVYVTENNLVNGQSFAFKRVQLSQSIIGSGAEGLIIKITTGANNSVEIMDSHFGVTLN